MARDRGEKLALAALGKTNTKTSVSFRQGVNGSRIIDGTLLVTKADLDTSILKNNTINPWLINANGVIKAATAVSVYLGELVSEPSNPYSGGDFVSYTLKIGDTYRNTTDENEYYWNGSDWINTEARSSFVSIVFKRSATKPNAPTDGDFSSPIPTDWEDGIPEIDVAKDAQDPVWWTAFTFNNKTDYSGGVAWPDPVIASDTETQDLMYNASPTEPLADDITNDSDLTAVNAADAANGWHNDATVGDRWAAIRVKSKGVWSAWQVYKILGEDGTNGSDGYTPELGSDYSDGESVAIFSIFKEVSNATIASGVLTPSAQSYNGTTLTVNNGWSDDPIITDTENKYLLLSKGKFVAEQIGGANQDNWLLEGVWSTPVNYTLRKGIDYVDGVSGDYVSYVYKEGPVVEDPFGGSYDGTTEVLPDTAWLDESPIDPTEIVWFSSARYKENVDVNGQPLGTWTHSGWSDPAKWYERGADAWPGNFTSYIFKRSTTQPVDKPNTADLSDLANNHDWSDGVPGGTETLWVRFAEMKYTSATVYGFKDGGDWGDVVQVEGKDGDTTGLKTVWNDQETKPVDDPSIPTGPEGSWTASNGWYDDSSTGTPIWAAYSVYQTNVWSAWDVIRVKGEKGEDGLTPEPGEDYSDGNSYARISIFKTVPNGTLLGSIDLPTTQSYNGTVATMNNSWSDDPTLANPSTHFMVMLQGEFVQTQGTDGKNIAGSWTFKGPWTPIVKFSLEKGVDYIDGVSGDYISYVYMDRLATPAKPIVGTGSYTVAGGEILPDSAETEEWEDASPLTAVSGTIWYATARYKQNIVDGEAVDVWTNQGWSTPVKWYQKGIDALPGNFTSYIFKRSGTIPTDEPNTADLSGNNNGWSDEVPVGTDTLWTRFAEMTYTDKTTYTFVGSGWNAVVQVEGKDGDAAGLKVVWNDNVTTNPPTVPAVYTGTWTDTATWVDDGSSLDPVWSAYSVYDGAVWSAWVLVQVKGEKGADGVNGYTPVKGVNYFDGIPGTDGRDGDSAYQSWLNDGNSGTTTDFLNSLVGQDGINGSDGIAGTNGVDGITTYTWIKYADSSDGLTGFSNTPTGKPYIGFAFNKTTATESTTAGDYTWSLIKGADGSDGAKGDKGEPGTTGDTGSRGSTIARIYDIVNTISYYSSNSNLLTNAINGIVDPDGIQNGDQVIVTASDGTEIFEVINNVWGTNTGLRVHGNMIVDNTITASSIVLTGTNSVASSLDLGDFNNAAGFTDDTLASSAQSTANSAQSAASSAQSTANTAVANAAAAQATADGKIDASQVNGNVTSISGGVITTGTINALRISAVNLNSLNDGTNTSSRGSFSLGNDSVNGFPAVIIGDGSGSNCGVAGQSAVYGVIGGTTGAGGSGVAGYSNTGTFGVLGHQGYGAYSASPASFSNLYPFTGSHYCYTQDVYGSFVIGDILESVDAWVASVNQGLVHSTVTTTANSKTVFGVVNAFLDNLGNSFKTSEYYETDESDPLNYTTIKPQYKVYIEYMENNGFREVSVNSLGEGGINVCEANGDIENGDYICSSNIRGKGMKQDDDLMYNYTVAKALEDCIWADQVVGEAGVFIQDGVMCKMIACTYHAG